MDKLALATSPIAQQTESDIVALARGWEDAGAAIEARDSSWLEVDSGLNELLTDLVAAALEERPANIPDFLIGRIIKMRPAETERWVDKATLPTAEDDDEGDSSPEDDSGDDSSADEVPPRRRAAATMPMASGGVGATLREAKV
jgi:hypothetical protein